MAKKDFLKLTQEEIAKLSPSEFEEFQKFLVELKDSVDKAETLIKEQAKQIKRAEEQTPAPRQLPGDVAEKYSLASGLTATKIVLPAPDRREFDFSKISLAVADDIFEKFPNRYLILKK